MRRGNNLFDREQAKEEIAKQVQDFKDDFNQYKLPTYKEAQVRIGFLDKLFKALGWDVDNKQGFSEQFKIVSLSFLTPF